MGKTDSSWYIRPDGIKQSISVGGIVIRIEDGKILIALVKDDPYSDYILPKGAINAGETLEETARREILEEAGLENLVLLGKLGIQERLNYRKTAWKIIHYFLFFTEQKVGRPIDTKHNYICEWFPIDTLPPMFWEEQYDLIEKYRDEIHDLITPIPDIGADCHRNCACLLHHLQGAVLILNRERQIIFANSTAQKMLASDSNYLIGKTFDYELDNDKNTFIQIATTNQQNLYCLAQQKTINWFGHIATLVYLHDTEVCTSHGISKLLAENQEGAYLEQRLLEITRTISSDLDLGIILRNIVNLTVDLVGADVGALGLVIPNTYRLTSPYLFDSNEKIAELRGLPKGEELAWHIIQTGESIFLTPDILNHLPNEKVSSSLADIVTELHSMGVTGVIGAAITAKDSRLGALLIYTLTPSKVTNIRYLMLVDSIGRQAGIAIKNARLYEEIQELAVMDSLTGLFNRRHFYDLGQQELERAWRYNHPLSVAMIDIDLFKKVNDQYGHAVGDLVLQKVTHLCKEESRQTDILGRLGGEEFVILMPETDLQCAHIAAERIRKRVEDTSIPVGKDQINVTISTGVSMFAIPQETTASLEKLLEELIHSADDALYRAKHNGRNLVVLAEKK